MRSQLPTLELDAVFEAKEELALAVKNALATVMSGYGYCIIQVRLMNAAKTNLCHMDGRDINLSLMPSLFVCVL